MKIKLKSPIYIRLSKKKPDHTDEIGNGVLVDYDRKGQIVGIELLVDCDLRITADGIEPTAQRSRTKS